MSEQGIEKAKALAIELGVSIEYFTKMAIDGTLGHERREEIVSPDELIEPITNSFYPKTIEEVGVCPGFAKTNGKIYFRPDELSIWSGINGHGKSQFLGQIALNTIDQGQKFMIISLEMRIDRVLNRLFRQISGLSKPSEEYIKAIANFYTGKLFLLDHVGSIKKEYLQSIMQTAVEMYGVKYFLIDSLMKCGMREDDYNEQKDFVDMLCNFKSYFNCHIHLIAHPRKAHDESMSPGKLDIKGTGTITDMADSCFSVWRNKKKELNPENHMGRPDCFFECTKQRNGEWEGAIPLWFDKESFQYLDYEKKRPQQYVEFSTQDKI